MDPEQGPGSSSSTVDDFANASAQARDAARLENPAESPELEDVAAGPSLDENDAVKYGNDPGSRDAFLQTSRTSQLNILRDYNQIIQNIPAGPIDAKDVKRNNWSGLPNMVSRINETNENLRVLARLGGEMMQCRWRLRHITSERTPMVLPRAMWPLLVQSQKGQGQSLRRQ